MSNDLDAKSCGSSWLRRQVVSLSLVVSCVICGATKLAAQEAGFQPRAHFALVGGKLHAAGGAAPKPATVIVRDGVIEAVGTDLKIPVDVRQIDVTGHVIYPGFIDAASTVFVDPEKVPKPAVGDKVDFGKYVLAATRRDNRKGLTPAFRIADAIKLESGPLDGFRKLGFTASHVLASGRIASGQSVLVHAGGANLTDAPLTTKSWMSVRLYAPGGNDYPATLMGSTAHLRQALLDAQHDQAHQAAFRNGGGNVPRPRVDDDLQSLAAVLSGEQTAIFETSTNDDIHRALDFAAEFVFAPLLIIRGDYDRAIDRIIKQKVNVILTKDFGAKPKIESPTHSDDLITDLKPPRRVQQEKIDRWTQQFELLNRLLDADIKVALGSFGGKDANVVVHNIRTAAKNGVDVSKLLPAVTSTPAGLLGLEKKLGGIKPGMMAHLSVMTGPIEDERSKVRHVFIEQSHFEYNDSAKPVETKTDIEHAQVAGKWNIKIEGSSEKLVASVEFAQDKDNLTGHFASERGNGRLSSGKVADNKVTFAVSIGAGARTVELKFEGTLKKDEITGKLKSPFGAETAWSAKREPAPKEENPLSIGIDTSDDKPKSADKKSDNKDQPTELQADRLAMQQDTGGTLIIGNATVLTGTGQTLSNMSVYIKDGKIAEIKGKLAVPANVKVIDGTGLFVMPGIIDTHSHMMIQSGTNEYTQSVVCEVGVKDVINSEDTSEYRALAGGVTTARLLHGSSNVVGGQDAVVKLKFGKSAREHRVPDHPQGVKFALGENVKYRTTRFPNTRLGVEATLQRAFLEAIDYRRKQNRYKLDGSKGLAPRRDLRLEALARIVDKDMFIHCHCYRADEILMLLRVATQHGFKIQSLQHVLEGYKVAPEIVAHGASCSTFADWWAYKVEAYDATAYNAALLHEAGANTVIKSDDRELIRHMYYEAAKPVRYGSMPPDAALQTVTLNSARELMLHDRIGSIEVGKDGDLAVFNGHPFDSFSHCVMTIIEGNIYFDRSKAPTAMSAAGKKTLTKRPEFSFPSVAVREKSLDLTASKNGTYAIVGATIHSVDKPTLPGGFVLIENGRIKTVGEKFNPTSGVKVIDASGLHIYPGLIDAGTKLGIVEIGKVNETQDDRESGQFQPDLRAGVAVNIDSELIPVARAGGITTALIRPTGGTIAGQASIIQLAGWTSEEMAVNLEAGLQIQWPSSDSDKTINQLREFLDDARFYDKVRSVKKDDVLVDPRYEALRPYVAGKKPVFIEANRRKQIAEALKFAEDEKLKVVITGGTDAWKLADHLKKRDVPVIVGAVMQRPVESHDPQDAPYANAGLLHEAGVKFCIRSDDTSNSRNTPFEAAMAVAHGLPADVALRSVTLSAAEILGIDKQAGSISPGKQANLVITDGSPMQITSQVKGVFINGQPIPPESRQTRFYERYRARLKQTLGK